jgi:hypothetical protein
MKIELKQIIDQLIEVCGLSDGYKVSALIDDENDNKITGWIIVKIWEDGRIKPINNVKFKNINELINAYL